MTTSSILGLGLALCLVTIIVLAWRMANQASRLKRYKAITDVEAEAKALRARTDIELTSARATVATELAQLRAATEAELQHFRIATTAEAEQKRLLLQAEVQRLSEADAQLRQVVTTLTVRHQELTQELAVLDERVDMQEVALYEPRYHFQRSDDYKSRLKTVYEQQKDLMKAKRAAFCTSEWTVNNSRAEGRKVTDKIVRLMLRAFNGECDAMIARVRYDNIVTYAARIQKSFDDINKLGGGFSCLISTDYRNLKLHELTLVHEYQERLQQEREEQRELKEAMREEQRALQELERAQRDAEKEATRYANALERARAEAEAAVGAKHEKLALQIAELEQRLRETEEQQRAISMAQQTKRGHVYILSNIGSFGEHVYKIGMTRRLNPQDRVDELGDASVPFSFDVHALIRTDDAPKLERALHELFAERRLNKVNTRKEFFRVALEEVEAVVRTHHGEFQLTRYAEASHYRQTLAIESQARSIPRVSRVSAPDQQPSVAS